ncbi:RagB/SusD family nutrient uptake outer membrane protein [Arcicella aquatica]|uniref:RagB/SusD family nutrient uptake outer membrane protein n=1 Tax=Arcicella aquatica TaxID=217141 RepID=A0ABU5QRR0_9BACT|nr:RagB/SusD family nutrient uptake outer membrane protein [Arcicella aquatica]MEA5259698.1 RagB/SusD family nutrient uptake outer membrane protein [Arcicella aquatica]
MINIHKKIKGVLWATAFTSLSLLSSCESFVELGAPPTQVVSDDVFKADVTANSAILGLYNGNIMVNFIQGASFYPGMSADDIQYNYTNSAFEEFENNALTSINASVENTTWFYGFQQIKNANNAIAGLNKSQTLTPSVKEQLLGEAKFIRALSYFYLVNLFGDVPMSLTPDADYEAKANSPRTPATTIWAQIITDLKEAQTHLPTTYVGTFKGRVNKHAATTLLARAYLYNKDWANAETQASQVITAQAYTLPAPADAFVNTSTETIWQIANTTGVSTFGANYLAATGVIPNFSLYDTLYKSFEEVDLRKINWTGVTKIATTNYYFINKYKVRTGTGNEYNIGLRFAELYLIRSEAQAQQGKLVEAKADADIIRKRAGLAALSSTITKEQLLLAIEKERKLEFFGEWGHRWLDLKRTNRADAVIGGQKPKTWKSTAVLYPIPENQRLANKNLTQNAGY